MVVFATASSAATATGAFAAAATAGSLGRSSFSAAVEEGFTIGVLGSDAVTAVTRALLTMEVEAFLVLVSVATALVEEINSSLEIYGYGFLE